MASSVLVLWWILVVSSRGPWSESTLLFSLFSIQELKERFRLRTNLPLGPSIDTHGETFLSQEVVVSLLQETRHAFERCHRVRLLSASP